MRAFQPLHLPIRAVQSTTQCLRQRLITPYAFSHPQSSVFQSFPANRTSPFSTSTTLLARKNRGPKKDQRISPAPLPSALLAQYSYSHSFRYYPLPPSTPRQSSASSFLPLPPPSPLDHPPCLADAPGPAAHSTAAHTRTPIQQHARRVRGVAPDWGGRAFNHRGRPGAARA